MLLIIWPLRQLGHRQLSHQDPVLKHHRSSPTANRCPLWGGGVLLLYWGAVGVFYSPSRQGGLVICLYRVVLSTAIYHQQFNLTSVTCLLTVEWSNSSFSNNSILLKSFVCTELNVKSFYLTHSRTLSGATTPGQTGPGSNGNEEVLCIPQRSSITEASPSDCLVSYPGHSSGGGLTPLQRYSRHILQPQPTGQCIHGGNWANWLW